MPTEAKASNGLLWMIAAIAGLVTIIGTNVAITIGMMATTNLRITTLASDQTNAEARWVKAAERWQAEADKIGEWIGEHDRRIEARDASEWERIKSLEWDVRGYAAPITIAPGEEP